jgi:SAM-dependent methyltransferase
LGLQGQTVRVERDERSLAVARARAKLAGYDNVCFVQSDINAVSLSKSFDAVVGRFILQFVPNPAGVLRSVVQLLKPGGVVAFQEPSFAAFLHVCPQLRLWSAAVTPICASGRRAGVNVEMGFALHNVFQEAGLPAPKMYMDTPFGGNPDFTGWVYDFSHAATENSGVQPIDGTAWRY